MHKPKSPELYRPQDLTAAQLQFLQALERLLRAAEETRSERDNLLRILTGPKNTAGVAV